MIRRLCVIALVLAPLFLSGCVLNTILDDVVNSPPRSVIDAAPTQGAAPLSITLDAHYSHDDDGSIVEYRWDLGDPAAATGAQLGSTCTHTYQYPGTYLVKLSVIDNEGAADSQQVAIVVTNAPPVAQATVSNPTPYPGDPVAFDASESYDATGTIVSYAWSFGDGGTGEGVTATHTYSNGGSYMVRLTVTDNEAASSDTTLVVNVRVGSTNCDDGDCGDSYTPFAVIAGLPSGCSRGRVGVPVTVDGTYSIPAVGNIIRCDWNFGDGSTATGDIVSHTYTYGGAFLVTLWVTDEGGGVGTASSYCYIATGTCP